MQRYFCRNCRRVFQNERRKKRFREKLWNEYVWGKQTLVQLSKQRKKSIPWIRKELTEAPLIPSTITPRPTVVVCDTTFWGRHYGVTLLRSQEFKANLWWDEVESERQATYHYGRKILESQGWTFKAAVVDGRRGLATVFADMPVQICQFHQVKLVRKHLSRNPGTKAARELLDIAYTLKHSNEHTFTLRLERWHRKWGEHIEEKKYVEGVKRPKYVNDKTRKAFNSLKRNLPYLFTYQKYPELNIPNTTNTMEGSFSQLKERLGSHRGMTKEKRWKMICEVLKGEN